MLLGKNRPQETSQCHPPQVALAFTPCMLTVCPAFVPFGLSSARAHEVISSAFSLLVLLEPVKSPHREPGWAGGWARGYPHQERSSRHESCSAVCLIGVACRACRLPVAREASRENQVWVCHPRPVEAESREWETLDSERDPGARQRRGRVRPGRCQLA